MLIGFGCAFTFLSLALKTIELSSAYATWSGVGTALTALVGLVLFNETIHMKGFIGLALVICGVIVLNQSKNKRKKRKNHSIKPNGRHKKVIFSINQEKMTFLLNNQL